MEDISIDFSVFKIIVVSDFNVISKSPFKSVFPSDTYCELSQKVKAIRQWNLVS